MSASEDSGIGGEWREPDSGLAAEQREEDRVTALQIARVQAGDTELYGEVYQRYFKRVYLYLQAILRNREEAEDAAQEVFLKGLEKISSYEPREPFRAWLLTILRNQAIDHLRKMGRVEPVDPFELQEHPALEAEAEPEPEIVNWISDYELSLFMERLPLPQRQVLFLRYMLGLGTGQMGELLGRNHEDIRALHSRAVRFLRKRLAAVGRTSSEDGGGGGGGGEGERNSTSRIARDAIVLRRRRFSLF